MMPVPPLRDRAPAWPRLWGWGLPFRRILLVGLLGLGPPAPAGASPPLGEGWGRVGGDASSPETLADSKALAASLMKAVAQISTANQAAFDVHSYALDLLADPSLHVLSGSVTAQASVSGGPLASLDLNLYDNMVVDSVRSGAIPTTFTHAGDVLSVTLDHVYATGEGVTVQVWYHGTPSAGVFGSIFSFDSFNGRPLLWTLSEPFGARAWWPCKDVPDDKADSVEVRLTVPSGMITASNGTLVESSDNGTFAVARWKERFPIATYLVSIASHAYTVSTDWYHATPSDSMPLRFYVFPEHAASAALTNVKVKNMIAAFATRYGPYPFLGEKYGEAEFTWGGGMENQTITSLGTFTEYVLAHELSHHWWGDLVTCRDFHHIWLNEGFATYSEALWKEASLGVTFYRSDMTGKKYLGAGTIYVPNDQDGNRVFDYGLTYKKGSWVLHMLRHVLGDATFFASLQAYRQQHAYGTAVTEDFRDACEGVAGRDLHAFFQQWIYGENYPQYRSVTSAVAALGGGFDVTVLLQQIQSGPAFWMPVDVAITTASGTQTFVAMDSLAVQSFTFHVDASLQSVAIDPNEWILRTVSGPLVAVDPAAPGARFALEPARPNPARGQCAFAFTLPASGTARLTLYDIAGARVRTIEHGTLPAGRHEWTWDGRDAAGRPVRPGIYVVRLDAAGATREARVALIE